MRIPKAIYVCGLRFEIAFVSTRRMTETIGTRCYGGVDFEKGIIYMDKSLRKSPSRLRDTLFHEIGHVIFESSGIGWWTKKEAGLYGKKWSRFQEAFIRLLTPVLFSTLRDLGWLKEIK